MGTLARALFNVGNWIRETGQAIDRLGCSLQGRYCYKEQLSRHRPLMHLFGKVPEVAETTFVAPSSSIIGDVKIGAKSSVWYGSVLRGDVNSIRVGSMTNLQDGTIVHVAKTNIGNKVAPTVIGNKVTVGHNAVLHACTVEDEAFIGMGATVLDGSVVEKNAMVAAGALVTQNTRVPSGQIWAGVPAKFLRPLSDEEKAFITKSAENYAEVAEVHRAENSKTLEQILAEEEEREDASVQDDDYDSHLGIDRKALAEASEKSPQLPA